LLRFKFLLCIRESDGSVYFTVHKLLRVTIQQVRGRTADPASAAAYLLHTNQDVGIFSAPRICERENVFENFSLANVIDTLEGILIRLEVQSL
jgi:hypothetical protein